MSSTQIAGADLAARAAAVIPGGVNSGQRRVPGLEEMVITATGRSTFTDATGRPVVPARSAFAVDGMRVTLAEFTGSYARGVGSGPQGAFLPGQTLVAAIVETSRGNLIFQLHGPTATVAAQRPALLGLIRALTRAA